LATPVHEFVCADCKSDVFSFGGESAATRCASCEVVAEMREERGLTPQEEAELRVLLGCELPKGEQA
jgi:hypothetical protein